MNKTELTELEKEFVPYIEALELKELGFDNPFFAAYDEDGYFDLQDFFQTYETVHSYFVAAPTYSQAFRFFRGKGVRFEISPRLSDLGIFYKVLFPDGQEKNVSYDTYEEAELACLRKLIEIAKQQRL